MEYTNQLCDDVFESIIAYIHDSRDRHCISLVCRQLYEEEARTRKHVTVALCYSTTPQQLLRRFPFLESLKLKGKPRAAVFNLIPEDWGGFATPWVEELSKSFRFLKALHFRRMIVKDEDLELLAREKGDVLEVLKLDKCSGFSTDGLLHICRSCRNLKVLFLEESQVIEKDGNWLHELAINNTQLETLNFYMTDLSQFHLKNSVVVALTTNPRSMQIRGIQTRDVIGNKGMEVLARSCKKMKRLRIERGADEQELEDEEGVVSQRGLTAIAQGCLDLEYIAVYVSDITNAALESMGMNLKNLCDFRMVLLDKKEVITDLPLDNGIRSLLSGCNKLRRFAIYLRPGGLTDMGLTYIGQHSQNIRWMLLGYVGESDSGLLGFSRGCPSLQKLEIRGCCFSETALATAVLQLKSLRYLWVQGYIGSETGLDLLTMARPYWNIELIPPRKVQYGEGREIEHPAHILAYYSLAGPRTDFPPSVIPLGSVAQ
ncbi:putative leucine-rich repeat domain superfamily, transport inhibitor response 1 [Helianthus annuus]|nr:putative leucine-rich repeat domain superfamily, transport inhibitor response 1 [Helianthus annuus]